MRKISSNQIFVFAFILSCFMFPGFGDTELLQVGKNSTIIASIIGVIIGFIPLILILLISKQTTDKNIFELNIERFKFFGYVLNTLLILSVIYIIINSVWSVVNFNVSQFLTRTSYYYVLFSICLIVAIAVLKGLEVIGRTAIILMFIFVGTSIFAWIFLIPSVDINNLYPLIDVGKKDFIQTVFSFPMFASIPLISLLFIKKNNIVDKEKYNKKVILGYILGSLYAIIFLFFIISIFGIDLSVLFSYPEYTVFKKINAFDFIQRVENIISIVIFIASFISFSFLASFLVEGIKSSLKIKDKKKTNILALILIFVIPFVSTYLFINKNILFIFTNYPYFSIVIFIILLINCFLILVTNKKKAIK